MIVAFVVMFLISLILSIISLVEVDKLSTRVHEMKTVEGCPGPRGRGIQELKFIDDGCQAFTRIIFDDGAVQDIEGCFTTLAQFEQMYDRAFRNGMETQLRILEENKPKRTRKKKEEVKDEQLL